jgi:hypothetical protein
MSWVWLFFVVVNMMKWVFLFECRLFVAYFNVNVFYAFHLNVVVRTGIVAVVVVVSSFIKGAWQGKRERARKEDDDEDDEAKTYSSYIFYKKYQQEENERRCLCVHVVWEKEKSNATTHKRCLPMNFYVDKNYTIVTHRSFSLFFKMAQLQTQGYQFFYFCVLLLLTKRA